MSVEKTTKFVNCSLCIEGKLEETPLVVSADTGLILESTDEDGGDVGDLKGAIIAPGFLELQTNGVNGFHFTHFESSEQYERKLEETARYYASVGVTGFWATIPTVSSEEFQKILPHLSPRPFPNGATLLGAHVEGPYLHPSKKGAHNSTLFHPTTTSPSTIYGASNLPHIKYATVAPELPGAPALIKELLSHDIKVSLGHSTATYAEGVTALAAGAGCLTHTLNCMLPLTAREPGLAGLINHSPSPPYWTVIPDGHHVHPSNISLFYSSAPDTCILITDSIELCGLADGVYPGHAQIPLPQRKTGTRVTIAGTETLVGSCISLQEGVRNLMRWTGCGVEAAVRTVGENVAEMMGVGGKGGRGKLERGWRGDFVVLDKEGEVLETWVAGRRVWRK
ncbi:carbohydrate esterase family 9 protein [Aulographum hederae CBS 113979]|uniref:N-acetylglucosamine-6-phosphate deacetylase n=1 Tax=Aulographum hederae CBS 113979 TaxID=1176131 RepID=A0A6G1HDY8_9PEZI|nr:carbohydrate esterase family 9 protein [Aulographum hederae CBS 113979]